MDFEVDINAVMASKREAMTFFGGRHDDVCVRSECWQLFVDS